MKGTFPYRADIDGLRAVAIVGVVLYHLKVPGFDAGFIGVDFFFAISGFVIFSVLSAEHERDGRVRWFDFYARRVIRLLPEAAAMIAAVLIAGFFVLLPVGDPKSDHQVLAESAIAGASWVTNIYLWRFAGDYFLPSVERLPLLHMWSLGVEEQFYLAVPLLFYAAHVLLQRAKLSWRKAALLVLAVCGVMSLCLAVWAVSSHPGAAYYALPTRAYEFCLGALAAIALRDATWRNIPPGIARAMSLVGMLGIVGSLLVFDRNTDFPGPWALLPAGACTLIILANGQPQIGVIQRLLQVGPLTFLGRISYGWYLWHWPALVLWREYWLYDVTLVGETAIALLTLIPATIGYLLVSNLRTPRRSVNVRVFKVGATASAAIVSLAGALMLHAQFVGARSPDIRALQAQLDDKASPKTECHGLFLGQDADLPECSFGDQNGTTTVIVWGDSHASHWIAALEPLFIEYRIRGIERTMGGCPSGLSDGSFSGAPMYAECRQFTEKVLRDLEERSSRGPVAVLLSARWAAYMSDRPISLVDRSFLAPKWAPGEAVILDAVSTVLGQLRGLGIRAGIVLQVPEQRRNVPLCLRRHSPSACAISEGDEMEYLAPVRHRLVTLANRSGALVLDPAQSLCRQGTCEVKDGDVVLYHDDDHLSRQGAQLLLPVLRPFVADLVRGPETGPSI